MENEFTINQKKVLDILFTYPSMLFSAREIARITQLTHPTVLEALHVLLTAGLASRIIKENISGIGVTISWKAEQKGAKYTFYKKIENLKKVYTSHLIEKIAQETTPNAIILFGSYSRGEDTEKSDIDIFVLSKEHPVDLKKYEKKLHRKINLTFEENITKLNKQFLNNLINGVIIYGYLEVTE
jgi:predicted nucleotidyltransferase